MIPQLLADGVVTGSTYALIAIGFTLIIGVLGVLNMAHQETMMIAAVTAAIANAAGVPIHLGAPCALAASVALGLAIERLAIRPVSRGEILTPVIATVGASLLIEHGVARFYSPDKQVFGLPLHYYRLGRYVQISDAQIATVGVTAALAAGLWLVLYRTRLGKAIRAVSERPDVAACLGIDVTRIIQLSVALSALLAGCGGLLIGWLYNSAWAFMGIHYGLKGLVAMILGGVSSVWGSMLAGLMIGVAESFTVGYISSSYRDAVAFGLLILLLLIRPHGLGERIPTRD